VRIRGEIIEGDSAAGLVRPPACGIRIHQIHSTYETLDGNPEPKADRAGKSPVISDSGGEFGRKKVLQKAQVQPGVL
jgi:hypothetical protein